MFDGRFSLKVCPGTIKSKGVIHMNLYMCPKCNRTIEALEGATVTCSCKAKMVLIDNTLKKYRREHRLTQQQLADQLQIARSYVARMETNELPVTTEVINKLHIDDTKAFIPEP